MKYAIKLRCFPPADQADAWESLTDDPADCYWEFGDGVEYTTEYMRAIVDERMRHGFSCKLIVDVESDLPPEHWDWEEITTLGADRIDFVRATIIEDQKTAIIEDQKTAKDELCFVCQKPLSPLRTYRDADGDGYCSRKCIVAAVGENGYIVTPGGKIYNKEES